MRKSFLITAFLLLTLALSAQQTEVHGDANPAAEAEIKALEVKLAELIVRSDWDEYAKHVSSDYLHTRENGRVESKAEAMESLRDAKRKIIFIEMEPASALVRIYGDSAVCSADFTITVRDSGQVKTHLIHEMDAFVKRDGQWWLVAGQGNTNAK